MPNTFTSSPNAEPEPEVQASWWRNLNCRSFKERKYLYGRHIQEIRVHYKHGILNWNQRSEFRFTKSMVQMLEELQKKGCIISGFLLQSQYYGVYCNKKTGINYFGVREKKGMISYLAKGKELILDDNGLWSRKGRQEMTPAKFARSVLNARLVKRLGDQHFANFASHFKNYESNSEVFFEYVPFSVGYDDNNYAFATRSCMVGKNVGPFYEKFGAKLLVAKRVDGKFIGRAIVWPSVEFKNEATPQGITYPYMDRIYTSNPEHTLAFKDYARLHGMVSKVMQGAGHNRFHMPDDNSKDGNYFELLTKIPGDSRMDMTNTFIPYLDSFPTLYRDEKTLSNIFDENVFRYTLSTTDGRPHDNGNKEGYIRNTEVGGYADPAEFIEYNGALHWKKGYNVVKLHGTDEYRYKSDPAIVNVYGTSQYYLKDDERIATCDRSKRVFLKESLIEVFDKKQDKNVLVLPRYAIYYTGEEITDDFETDLTESIFSAKTKHLSDLAKQVIMEYEIDWMQYNLIDSSSIVNNTATTNYEW